MARPVEIRPTAIWQLLPPCRILWTLRRILSGLLLRLS